MNIHLLRLVDEEDGPDEACLKMRFPAVAQDFEAAPAVPRAEVDTEDLAQFSVEVREIRLWSSEPSYGHVSECRKAFIEDAQNDIAKRYGFQILRHRHELYGHCADCATG